VNIPHRIRPFISYILLLALLLAPFGATAAGKTASHANPGMLAIEADGGGKARPAPTVVLPPDAQEKKDALVGLFALAQSDDYPVQWEEQVNSREKRLRSITIATNLPATDGVVMAKVPPAIARAWSLFSECTVRGKDLEKMRIVVSTADGKKQTMTTAVSKATVYSGKCANIKIDRHWENCVLELHGAGELDTITFHSRQGLSPVFDDRAWSVLGGDLPVLAVQVDLLGTTRRSIDGIKTLELGKFRRLYCHIDGPPEHWETLAYYKPKGFLPGRQMIKFGPLLEKAHGDVNAPKMTEDPDRPGWSDTSFFDQYYQPDEKHIRRLRDTYPPDFEYAMCLNYWPSWMQPKNLSLRNQNGTPAIELFDAAADLAGRYVEAEKRRIGRIANYWEVKNESDIQSEWMYHWEKDYDGWQLLADFHIKVAEAIKKRVPEVMVGGPTAAWPKFDVGGDNGFNQARTHLTFVDRTRDALDFYSYHFYEGAALIINDPGSENNYGGFLAGRLEGDLDLLQNHMILTDNVKPLIISETGTLTGGSDDVSHWIKLKNYNAYMMRYMNRANEFRLIVPFLLPVTWWDKDARDSLFAYQPDGTLKLTKQHLYLDFWQDYEGDLVVADTSTPRIFLHAVTQGNVVQLAVNNMNPQRVRVDINAGFGEAQIQSVTQKRLWLDRGILTFETHALRDLKAIPLSVEETSIVTVTLDRPLESTYLLGEKTLYGDKILQKTGDPIGFEVTCPIDNIVAATLRVCFGREGGFRKDLTVSINGKSYTEDLEYTDKPGHFFGYAEFNVPPESITRRNTVIVDIPQNGGTISTVALLVKITQQPR